MSYSALTKMRENLQSRYEGYEIGPLSPSDLRENAKNKKDFRVAVLHFIHERCTDLRFDSDIEKKEEITGKLCGKSSRENQIPYNMQMDIDRLCLARAIERFFDSGKREDAFDVYFCYLEMFGGGYNSSRRMIELLSEYESTASTMLMSHRDHYSHSVYVFLLGLAMFDSISIIRNEYKRFYNIDNDQEAAHHFLQFWGLSSLFHDIGYPFEISFEQVKSYFTQKRGGSSKMVINNKIPFVCYGNMNEYLKLDEYAKSKLHDLYEKNFDTIEEWLASDITSLISRSNCDRIKKQTEQNIISILKREARYSNNKKYMDHAYFSAVILFKELFETQRENKDKDYLKREHMDAITAIALHNALYKREITNDKALKFDDHAFMIEWHPLAYILQLADEIHCWDRTSYGRNTKTELNCASCNIVFDDKGIYADYIYDMAESKKIIDYWTKYEEYRNNPKLIQKPKLKRYSAMTHDNSFAKEIGLIVGLKNYGSCKGSISFEVTQKVERINWQNKNIYLSSSNFIHLYEFAAALNAQYNYSYSPDKEMLDDFDMLSLEYKLSNIGQAKNFAKALDFIGCFYTDQPVAYEMVMDFTEDELLRLGEFEHNRWEKEKQEMFWLPGKFLEKQLKENNNELREMARMHYDLEVKFSDLNNITKKKDIAPLNIMMNKLLEFDGIRVYRYK